MRLKNCRATNFGSYKDLSFDFSNLGLALVHGATGSGKSTLQDLACWTLFGVTAKNGNADEVRSWLAPDSSTISTLEVESPKGTIYVTRIRGKASQNDLYYTFASNEKQFRGKDLTETQVHLNEVLGVDADLYLTGAYFCEFSPTAAFFVSKAKDRREVFERIANLSLPVTLAEKSSSARREVKAALTKIDADLARVTGRIEQINTHRGQVDNDAANWDVNQRNLKSRLAKRSETFEQDKAKHIAELEIESAAYKLNKVYEIQELETSMQILIEDIHVPGDLRLVTDGIIQQIKELSAETCPTCGASKDNDKRLVYERELTAATRAYDDNEANLRQWFRYKNQLETLDNEKNPNERLLEAAKKAVNNYAEELAREKTKINPFLALRTKLKTEHADSLLEQVNLKFQSEQLSYKFNALNQLYDLSFDLRGALLINAVRQSQDTTNSYLEKYFDSEIRVTFSLEAGDSLEVNIHKSGYPCVYKQLSKGQRGLLKLCFTLSIMKAAANSAGVHFSNLFFDEALDGLDSDLKVKAYNLFTELETEHEAILVIEHSSEFKTLFNKQYHVTLESDASTIEEQHV